MSYLKIHLSLRRILGVFVRERKEEEKVAGSYITRAILSTESFLVGSSKEEIPPTRMAQEANRSMANTLLMKILSINMTRRIFLPWRIAETQTRIHLNSI